MTSRNRRRLGGALVAALLGSTAAFAQTDMTSGPVRIAVIDIDRIAQEPAKGQELIAELQALQEGVGRERQTREQEIADLTNRAQSQLLSPEARADLARELERKQTDIQRWLEDQQRDFNERQPQGFAQLAAELGPVVEEVATEQQIQLILRVTPGLTFIMDPTLDISDEVIARFNTRSGADSGEPSS